MIALGSLLLLLPAALEAGDARQTVVTRIPAPIRIDGNLEKAVWKKVDPIGEFLQRDPAPGEKPTERTEVRLAYTSSTLYIAVRCFDSRMTAVRATQMGRDATLDSDDRVEIVLDTFHDRRNAYYFATNPVGALVDGRIVSNDKPSLDWDGIWNVRTHRDEEGWNAEFEIPFKTLGFNANRTDWGFNIARALARKQEYSTWASPVLDLKVYQVSDAGVIEGLEGLEQGIGLDVKASGITGFDRRADQNYAVAGKGSGSVDAFYRITSNLVSSTTINTDFAETQADARQVNLTRFPITLPEKRAFFLEDAGVFDFAPGERFSKDSIGFFSRRIGLVNGQEVPIDVGEKLTGRVGRFDIGLLGVKTRSSDIAPARNFVVGRVKASLLEQSYIGVLFTDGEPTGNVNNHMAGVDLRLFTSKFRDRKNLYLTAFAAKTSTTGLTNHDNAYGWEVGYPNDELFLRQSWQVTGENYNPGLGFVSRPGSRQSDSWISLRPRVRFLGLRQMYMEFGNTSYFNLVQRQVESRRILLLPLKWIFNSGDQVEFNVTPLYERNFTPFEIHEGVVIPVGGYWFNRYNARVNTASKRPFSYSSNLAFGPYYTGTNTDWKNTVYWRKDRHLTMSVMWEQWWVNLKEGSFRTSLAEARVDYAFSPYLSLANYIQYDTNSQNVGLQSRLRWIVRPGNEMFFVLNHGWQQHVDAQWQTFQTKIRMKAQYTFRF